MSKNPKEIFTVSEVCSDLRKHKGCDNPLRNWVETSISNPCHHEVIFKDYFSIINSSNPNKVRLMNGNEICHLYLKHKLNIPEHFQKYIGSKSKDNTNEELWDASGNWIGKHITCDISFPEDRTNKNITYNDILQRRKEEDEHIPVRLGIGIIPCRCSMCVGFNTNKATLNLKKK
jgi:hypothetical protein